MTEKLLHQSPEQEIVDIRREQISEHLRDMNFESGSKVMELFARCLRQKVDREFAKRLIHPMRGTGYLLSDGDP